MAREAIIGRIEECKSLDACMEQNSAQLIIVYGRRRVGKTYLINEYFDYRFSFKLTGAYKQTKDYQLRAFSTELNRKWNVVKKVPKDWFDAFLYLRQYLEQLPSKDKQVVFFDEMPWLDTNKSGFLPAFEWFWNDWASTCKNLVFIVAGSATSWMVDHLTNNKGGLFRRQTCRIYLEPFKLHEVEKYLETKNIFWSRYDIAECYMIMGGIPYYLSQLREDLSLPQNIDNLFFKKHGVLWDEFEQLYTTLFSNAESYMKVVEALSEKRMGLSRNELAHKLKISSNGNLTKTLNNLLLSGFIQASNFYGNKKKNTLYKLSDYYTSFYFHFIKDHYGLDDHYWTHAIDNTSRRAWTGYAFEQLCMDHIPQIKHKLGISGVLSEQFIWFTNGDEELGIAGAQIDLLIERRDRVINICEIKHSINEYVINKEYDSVLRNKIDAFKRFANSRNSLQMTLITTFGVKKNKYSNIAQSQIILDDLFHQ